MRLSHALNQPVRFKHLLLALALVAVSYGVLVLYEDHLAITIMAEHVMGLEQVVRSLVVER